MEENNNNEKNLRTCPGISIYNPETREVIAGVRYIDRDDIDKGWEIIGQRIYSENHTPLFQANGNLGSCQSCRDITIRLLREDIGNEEVIPSHDREKQYKRLFPIKILDEHGVPLKMRDLKKTREQKFSTLRHKLFK